MRRWLITILELPVFALPALVLIAALDYSAFTMWTY